MIVSNKYKKKYLLILKSKGFKITSGLIDKIETTMNLFNEKYPNKTSKKYNVENLRKLKNKEFSNEEDMLKELIEVGIHENIVNANKEELIENSLKKNKPEITIEPLK